MFHDHCCHSGDHQVLSRFWRSLQPRLCAESLLPVTLRVSRFLHHGFSFYDAFWHRVWHDPLCIHRAEDEGGKISRKDHVYPCMWIPSDRRQHDWPGVLWAPEGENNAGIREEAARALLRFCMHICTEKSSWMCNDWGLHSCARQVSMFNEVKVCHCQDYSNPTFFLEDEDGPKTKHPRLWILDAPHRSQISSLWRFRRWNVPNQPVCHCGNPVLLYVICDSPPLREVNDTERHKLIGNQKRLRWNCCCWDFPWVDQTSRQKK